MFCPLSVRHATWDEWGYINGSANDLYRVAGQKSRPFYIFKLQKIIKRFCTHQGQSIMNLPTICEFTSFTIRSGITWWIYCHLIIYLIAVGVISLHPYRKRPPSWKWPPFWIFKWLTCFFQKSNLQRLSVPILMLASGSEWFCLKLCSYLLHYVGRLN